MTTSAEQGQTNSVVPVDGSIDGRPLAERLLEALAESIEEVAIIAALDHARSRGAAREALYRELLEAVERRRASAQVLTADEDERLDDILDRLWGFCSDSRLLFPELPVLGQ